MTLTYFNDINVYFHMKNHYKMLKQVKSVIDTSIPQSLLKSPLAMHSLQKRWQGNTNEELRKIYNSPIYMPKPGGRVKKHNCLDSEAKSEVFIKTSSYPSRPATRRNSVVTPRQNLPLRSCSVGGPSNEKMFRLRQKKRPSASSNRSSTTENQGTHLHLDLEKENPKGSSESPQSTRISTGSRNSTNGKGPEQAAPNNFFKESSEEHDYLLFLLRITEDIIVNDYYSNNDIRQVFKFHIDANKRRLSVRKMQYHIGNLCKELNIDCKEYQTESTQKDDCDSATKFTNSPQSRSSYLINENFLNCLDCSAIRTSSLYKVASLSQMVDNSDGGNGDTESTLSPSLLRLLEKLSLGRVTECTEPVASTSTMNSPHRLLIGDFGREKEEIQVGDNRDESPIDFDTFVKELYSNEDNLISQNQNEEQTNEIIALENPPVEVPLIHEIEGILETQSFKTLRPDLLKKQSSKILPTNFLNTLKLSSKDSKSEFEISDKETKSLTNTDKYESDFEKSSSYYSLAKSEKSEKSNEEKVKKDENTPEKNSETIQSDEVMELIETWENNTKTIQPKKVTASDETVDNTIDEIIAFTKIPQQNIKTLQGNVTVSNTNETIDSAKVAASNNTEIIPCDNVIGLNNDETIHSDKVIASHEILNEKFESDKESDGTNGHNSLLVEDNQSLAIDASTNKSPDIPPLKIVESNNDDDLSNNKSLLCMLPVKMVESNNKVKTWPGFFNKLTTTSMNTDHSDETPVRIISNLSPNGKLQDTSIGDVKSDKEQTELSGQSLVITGNSDNHSPRRVQAVKVTRPKTISIFSLESPKNRNKASSEQRKRQIENDKGSDSSESPDKEKQDTILKVILQGTLSESDYVMIKGPVYVYKPLLESEPKLVVINDDFGRNSRRNSMDSQQSNRTFTVVHSPVREQLDADQQVDLLIDNIDEAIQFDQSLHSLVDDSMENILELTRRAYNRFADKKLLHSDYDLTPEKDLDHKYHHLMVDARTSVSGVNIKESLLLNDDYLVEHDDNQQSLNGKQQVINVETKTNNQKSPKDDQLNIKDTESYLKFDPKLFDEIYNKNRKLMGSASMPKLMMVNNSSHEMIEETKRNLISNGELLMGYTTDLMSFDIPSQESSLRSEGETYQNEKLKRGVPWSTYFN